MKHETRIKEMLHPQQKYLNEWIRLTDAMKEYIMLPYELTELDMVTDEVI